MHPSVGSPAPDFSLPDENGDVRSLADNQGQWLLLYFYPKDDTPGCTIEGCRFRDAWHKLQNKHCNVLGVSADSTESHLSFLKKNNLPFHLLADTEKKVIEAYGVWQEKTMMDKKYMGIVRTSFLIDPKGNIAKVYENVNPEEHAKEVLEDLGKLSS